MEKCPLPFPGVENPLASEYDEETRRYERAYQVMKSLKNNAGIKYETAVLCCMKGSFNTWEDELKDEKFRKAYYQGVVEPLKKTLSEFVEEGF